MLTRRCLLSATTIPLVSAVSMSPPHVWGAAASSFAAFLEGVRAQGQRSGISSATLEQALAGLQPNPKVLELDQHQPEFTMT